VSFLNPALLFGALLFAVPLIIHLLNRQRHKRRQWAAMEFLLRAYQKTRNRLRNENLLLLLLRCLLPVALALAIARPVLEEAAALLGRESGDHHVVVLDSSYSMGYRQGSSDSPFARGRELVMRLLERLDGQTEQTDRVTLVTAGVRPRFLVRGEMNLSLARARWLEVDRPDDAAGDLSEALSQVADAIEEDQDPQARVYLITDLQVRAFGTALAGSEEAETGPEFQDTIKDLVARIEGRDGTEFHLIDVGPLAAQQTGGTCDNVQIAGLRLDQPVAIARAPLTAVVTVQNRGTTTAQAQVTLDIDGAEPIRRIVQVEPGAEAEAEFEVTFRETGYRRLTASLQQDALAADDACYRVVHVRDRVRVLVIDGKADQDPLLTQEFFYRGVLDPLSLGPPGGAEPTPDPATAELMRFQVTACDTLALLSGQQDPERYDLVVLANVDRLNERSAAGLLRALRGGSGLLCVFGDRVSAESYNLHLHQAGSGPMPFRLGRRQGSRQGSGVARNPQIADDTHPTLGEFDEDVYREILQHIPVYRWVATELDDDLLQSGNDQPQEADPTTGPAVEPRDATVVLRLSDRDRSPLLVTASHGDGRAAFLTSAPGSEFDPDPDNRFDDEFIVFQLFHGLAQWLSLPRIDSFNVTVGTALTCSLPARPADVEVLTPERAGSRKVPVSSPPMPLPGGRYGLPAFTDTTTAGFYICDLQLERESGTEPMIQPFAVTTVPDEGELSYAAHDQVQQTLGIERVLQGLPSEIEGAIDADAADFGPSLLLLTLLLIIGEASMARYVSVRRS
jgi:hypothetical protein